MNTMKINREAWVVFLFSVILCYSNIWGYPITILDEAKNAEAAREMLLGNHFIPFFNDVLRTDKPPLHYFFMQLGYLIFGVNELGARFFSALFGAGFLTYFFLFLKKFSTRNIARMTTVFLLSSFFWVQEFHLAVPDPYFIVLLCSSWLFFFEFYSANQIKKVKSQKRHFIFLFFAFVGLATLAKGPLAIGLTGLIILLFFLFKKELNWRIFRKYHIIYGGLLVLIISTPWYLWIHIQTNGAFTDGFFYHHNIKRFKEEIGGHGGIFLLTWVYVLLGLFPFGAFIPQGIWHAWKFKNKSDLVYFSLIISVVVILFFSFSSTKLPNYTLPAIPFLAILIASYFEEAFHFETFKKWWNYFSLTLISLISLAIPIAVFILFKHEFIIGYQVIITLILSTITVVGLYFIWKYFLNSNLQNFILSIAFVWISIGFMIFYFVYPNLAKIEPVVQSSQLIENNEVVVFDNYDPAFNFNYQRTFKIFDNEDKLISFAQQNPQILVLTKKRSIEHTSKIEENFEIVFNQPSIFENYRTIILKLKQ